MLHWVDYSVRKFFTGLSTLLSYFDRLPELPDDTYS